MKTKLINSDNFDIRFKNLLRNKKKRDVLSGRFDLECINLKFKVDILIQFLSSFKPTESVVYKILFWENDIKIESFIKSCFPTKKYKVALSYKNRKVPGVIFIEEDTIDIKFINTLLTNHFNFEMAKEPSLNIRVQICISNSISIILLDIYDDRGFYLYFFGQS